MIPVKLESDQLNEFGTAFAAAQGDFEVADKDKKGYQSNARYASWTELIGATRPYLKKHGLSVQQPVITIDGVDYLHTKILHSSGQYIASWIKVDYKATTFQDKAKEISGIKRHAYKTILCIADDDEDMATNTNHSNNYRPVQSAQGQNSTPSPSSQERINKTQLEEIILALDGLPDTKNSILKVYSISDIAELKASEYRAVITKIREIRASKGLK